MIGIVTKRSLRRLFGGKVLAKRYSILFEQQSKPKSHMFQVPKTINPLGWTIVCVSDTHSKFGKIENFPPADMILHAGDFSNVGEIPDIEKFRNEFASTPYPAKIFIAGNHDLSLDGDLFCHPDRSYQFRRYTQRLGLSVQEYHAKAMEIVRNSECPSGFLQFLHDDSCEVSSLEAVDAPPIKIYGSPWQPEFFDWAFNLTRGPALAEKWSRIPTDTDILITHGPPYGILDKTGRGEKVGCEELMKLFDEKKIKPRLHVFGHIHEGYGAELVGSTVFCNASTCTLSYRPTNKPIVIFLPHDKTKPAEILSPIVEEA